MLNSTIHDGAYDDNEAYWNALLDEASPEEPFDYDESPALAPTRVSEDDADSEELRSAKVPGIRLSDTSADDVWTRTVVTDDGDEVEYSLTDLLSRPLSAPSITVPATHLDVANAAAAMLRGWLRHSTTTGRWFTYESTAWMERTETQVYEVVGSLIAAHGTRPITPYQAQPISSKMRAELLLAGAAIEAPDGRLVRADDNTALTHIYRPADEWSANLNNLSAITTLLSGHSAVVMTESFDAEPLIVNAAGQIHLLDESIAEEGLGCYGMTHRDTVTLSLGTTFSIMSEFDAARDCPRWHRFLREVTSTHDEATGEIVERPELVDFLQVAAGLTLLGEVREQVMLLLYGASGSNGKSVFINTLIKAFGSYAVKLPKAVLMNKAASAHTTDLTVLQGKRLAYVNEVKDARWDAETIREMISTEQMTARRMRENNIEWTPSHTLWALLNNLPKLPAGDRATWRRILVVPFDMRYYADGDSEEDKKASVGPINPNLERELPEELEFITRWIIEGLVRYYTDGLTVPTAIRSATREARSGSSLWTEFLQTAFEATGNPADNVLDRDIIKLWTWFSDENTQSSYREPSSAPQIRTLFAAEFPNAKRVGTRTAGKRHGPAHFIGVKLSDDGQDWLNALSPTSGDALTNQLVSNELVRSGN